MSLSEASLPIDTRPLIGMSKLMRLVYHNGDVSRIWSDLLARTRADPADASAWMDISVLLIATGKREQALQVQAAAVTLQQVYCRVFGDGAGPKIAAFVTAGDMMANTPIEFLLEGSDAVLFYVYVDAAMERLPDVPAVDTAFMAVGQSPENEAVLADLDRLLASWDGPRVVNGSPRTVSSLTRDGVHRLLADEPSILSPQTALAGREALLGLVEEPHGLAALLDGAAFPLVVRPAGTHAGDGMERLADPKALRVYLAGRQEKQFYVSPFTDYAGPDRLYRKQRIVFIEGRPFASHCAVSGHWMVHYLSAGMLENAARRAEEARWMEHFDTDFAVRHARAFEALNRRIGLDYFGVDCAEMPDGRLLVFEADVAMIVHDMDSEAIFPYKKPAMRKLFSAFQRALFDGRGKAARA